MTIENQAAGCERSNGVVPSEMIGMIGYAVRTPLHGAAGLLELLADSDLDHDQRRMLRQALTALDDLGSMVDRLLDLARVEAGQLELHPVEASVVDLVEYVVERTDGKAKPGVLVSAVCPPLIPPVTADSYRLGQVLGILVNNATEATVSGSVQLKVEMADEEGDPVGEKMIGLRFSVTDSGPGMPAEDAAQLLVPFWERDMPAPSSGIGTGLLLANRLVALMGGKLVMTTTPGQGTVVSFTLLLDRYVEDVIVTDPASPEPLARDLASPEGEMGTQATGRILVIEDNEVNRILAERQLTKLGYEVTSCSGGKEGVALAVSGVFDAVLMDYQMPEVDGLEATRRIRQAETHSGSHVPIIAVTASATPVDHDACLSAGMDDYLAKPVDLNRMNRTLQRWLNHDVVAVRPDELQSPEIAPGTIEHLVALMDGDRQAVHQLFESAFEELPVRRMRILAAARGGNPADLVGASRALGASCRSLGVLGLAGVCQDLEDYVERGAAGEIDGYMDRLALACRQTESLFSTTMRTLREDMSPNVILGQ